MTGDSVHRQDPFDLSALRRQTERQERENRFERDTAIADLRFVAADPRGRRLLARLIRLSGANGQSFTGDALASAWSEGRRSLGVELRDELRKHDFDRFVQMMREEDARDE